METTKLIETELPKLSIAGIAMVIKRDWQKVNYAARPYLVAMCSLSSITDNYIFDSGQEIVLRFLCNASTWRGDIARAVKKELKSRCN